MGKPGRPTDALKHRFARILEEANSYERFKNLLIKTKSDETFLRAFAECHDRAFGKSPQFLDVMNHDDSDERPTLEALTETIRTNNETIAALRKQLEAAGSGVGVETAQ